MDSISIISFVEKGSLKRNRILILDAIKSFEGKTIELILRLHYKHSTDPQRNYYWGIIIPLIRKGIKDEWGEIKNKDQANDFLKMQFAFREKINENTGQIVRIPISPTHEMNTVEREIYHEQCRQLAKDFFNITIPLPNEDLTFNYE